MKQIIVKNIVEKAGTFLTALQLEQIRVIVSTELEMVDCTPSPTTSSLQNAQNTQLLNAFIAAKRIEGCSQKTLNYYKNSIEKLLPCINKRVNEVSTNDIRQYLSQIQQQRNLSKVSVDNLRRIFSSFFAWLEDEDYITKSPVRRIHKVRTDCLVKEVLTDEQQELLRDNCSCLRDLALIDLLSSTGIRVGELVRIDRADVNFHERQCIVLGKGNKEREVYFNARTKLHLQNYLQSRTDGDAALFVSLTAHTRLTIGAVEVRLRNMGRRLGINKVHPHKFRRTLATQAIDKGMPIEQVQRLLGHVKIDTTLHYAMVNQNNVKMAHRKFLG